MNDRLDLIPAALYARVSSDRQDVDLSVAAQLRALRDYAEKNGYLVAREYIDEAESGRIADRPQFQRMLDEASKPESPFQEILVWKFSRFTRKREHAVAFKSMLRRRGVRVVSITEQADDTPTGKLLEAIIESVDEFYSENLAQEVTRGMRESASRGFWVTSYAPYGYKRVHVQDGPKKRPTLELNPPADAVVRRIFDMALQGKSILDVTKTLNAEGIPTTNGKKWLKTTIHTMLDNEAYTGAVVWGAKAKDGAPPVRVEDAHPAIISKGEFQKGQEAARLPRPQEDESPPRLQPLPAQRTAQVRDLRQGHDRCRGQERQVHLLRLPLPPQAGQRHLQDPQAQRQELRGAYRHQHQGERPHRVQHPRPREAAGRGNGRRDRRAAGAASVHRGGA